MQEPFTLNLQYCFNNFPKVGKVLERLCQAYCLDATVCELHKNGKALANDRISDKVCRVC